MTKLRRGRTDKTARHVRLYHLMLKSRAWKSLDAVARALYVEISARYAGPGSNNGRIPYSVREGAIALRVGKTKSATALQALQDRGFIVAKKRGGFNRKDRHATEWRLTEFNCDVTGALPTREYESWSPNPEIQRLGAHGRTDGTEGRTDRCSQADHSCISGH
jgi:hypothetical protein